jgi:hypothetical protein
VLAQPLHGEFDIARLQLAPAFDLSLIAVLGLAFEILSCVLPGGRLLFCGFLAQVRAARHDLASESIDSFIEFDRS